MKRGRPLARRTPLRRRSPRRRQEDGVYALRQALFLAEHPWCQGWLAERGLTEADLRRGGGLIRVADHTGLVKPPASTVVHHRNKRRGARLNDTRFWMALSGPFHARVEANKGWARARGYLLPFEADRKGFLPNNARCPHTDELLEIRAREVAPARMPGA